MLADILMELEEALNAGNKEEAEKLYRLLEKAGMDRYSAEVIIKSGVLKENV